MYWICKDVMMWKRGGEKEGKEVEDKEERVRIRERKEEEGEGEAKGEAANVLTRTIKRGWACRGNQVTSNSSV